VTGQRSGGWVIELRAAWAMLEVVAARRFKVRGGPSVARCPSVNDDEGSHGFGAVSGPVAWHVRKASLGSWRDGAQGRLLWCLAE
jgi:hypothetical protein